MEYVDPSALADRPVIDAGRRSPVVLAVVGSVIAVALAVYLAAFDDSESISNAEAAASNTTTSGGRLIVLWFVAGLLAILSAVSFGYRKRLLGSALAFAAAAFGFLSIACVDSGIVILIATPESPLAPNSPTVMTWQVLAMSWLVAAVPLVAAGLRVRLMGAGTTPRAILALAGAVVAWALSLILVLNYVDWWVNNGTWFRHPASAWAAHIPAQITRVLVVWLAACLLAVVSAFLLCRTPRLAAVLAAIAVAVGFLTGPLLGSSLAASDYYQLPKWLSGEDLSVLWLIAAVPLLVSAVLALPAVRRR